MWNDLNMTQRNELIKLYLNNGISSLDKMKEHYNSFATGGSLPDHDPNNPYHYHNAKGEKIVITPEEWEANVGKPYFKEIEDAVRAEQAAYPSPEYEVNPDFVRDLRSTYRSNMGNGYQNYRNFSSSLPQGYTFTSEGMIVDPQGNYYVQSGYRQSPRFTYSTDNPLRFTINKGKPIERNLTFYPVNMDKKVKAPLPVNRTLDVKAEYQAAVDNYIQNNINNRYGIGWYNHTSDSFKDKATYGTLGIFSLKNPDEYGWESGTEHYYPMSEGQRNKLNDAFNRVVDRQDKLGTYSKEDMLNILKAGGLEDLIDDFIATSTKPSRQEAEKKAVISIGPLEKVNTFATGGSLYQEGGPDEPPQDQTITVSNPLFTTKGTLSQENADWDLGNQYTFKDTMRGIGLAGDYFSSEGFRNRANIANEKYGYLYNIEKPLRRTIPQQAAFIRDDNNANAAFKFGLNNSLNPIFVGAHETGHHNPVFNNYTFGMTTEEKAELSNPESTLYSPLYRNDYRNIPEDWRNILRNENPINDHDAELSEAYSDLVGLRALLKAYGIFDSTDPNAKFTQEMLDAFRKKLGNKGNRFLDYHSDENVIKAINEIAQNNTTEDTIHYAALGGHLYQAGGPDNPKKKPKFTQSEEQYYDRNNDIIYAQDSIGEGYQHEYFHARPNTTLLNNLRPYYENLNDNRLIELGADLPFVKRVDNNPNYFYSPEEIGARVSAARYMLNKAGIDNIDIDFLRNARKNELQYGDNFRDLLHMYNDENLLQILNTQYSK